MNLQNGKNVVIARFANRDNAAGTAPEWSEPRQVTLNVTLRAKDFKRYKKGEILTLSVADFPWAEYGQYDYCGDGEFLCEEYRMQIIST